MKPVKRVPVFREDGTIEIVLTQGYVALIDAQDAHLADEGWYALKMPTGHIYAAQSLPTRYLHREVLGLRGGGHKVEGDHLDGNTLNCRRENLRIATPTQNRRNKTRRRNNNTGFAGVSYHKIDMQFLATLDGNYIGSFRTAEEANEARLRAEEKKWGIEPRRAQAHKDRAPQAFASILRPVDAVLTTPNPIVSPELPRKRTEKARLRLSFRQYSSRKRR